jgi:glutaredoxin
MKVEIFGASWCTSCKQVVSFCKNKNIEYEYIDIDDTPQLKELEKRLGHQARTVPQIFKDGELVKGGFSELINMI